MLFGAHMSTAGGVWRALERGAQSQCDVVQIFLKSNKRWFGSVYKPGDVVLFAELSARIKFAAIFGHATYLINLGAPQSANREKSIQSLVQEINLADSLQVQFVVMHPGAHLGAGEQTGLRQIIAGLDEVFEITGNSHVRIALENTAGQGTALGSRIEHLAEIYDHVKSPERLGLCVDTAHLFAGGYDIRSAKGWEKAIERISSLIGRKEILAFHLNDSKTDLGSRVDRHAHIGKGKIGLDGFRHIANDPRFTSCPGCLETPKSKDLHEDIENLAVLRSLAER
jgi:deoxyribonuclease-4